MSSYLHTRVEHDSIIILYFLLFTRDVQSINNHKKASSWRELFRVISNQKTVLLLLLLLLLLFNYYLLFCLSAF